MKKEEEKDIRIKTSPPFALLDREGKRYQAINLRKQFGFLPDTIIIERSPGTPYFLVVRAVLTEAEIEKEKAMSVKKT